MSMTYEDIRPLTLGVIWRGDEILVYEIEDPSTGETFCRPIGGGVEFGETSNQALVREFREELDIEIENFQLIGIIENLFSFDGQQCHQNEFIYDVEFADNALYSMEHMIGTDDALDDEPITYRTNWASPDEFDTAGKRLVPDGLVELLTDIESNSNTVHPVTNAIDR
jgi:ADP-ribose pyrophosphatase YjhB (NUDIX family)